MMELPTPLLYKYTLFTGFRWSSLGQPKSIFWNQTNGSRGGRPPWDLSAAHVLTTIIIAVSRSWGGLSCESPPPGPSWPTPAPLISRNCYRGIDKKPHGRSSKLVEWRKYALATNYYATRVLGVYDGLDVPMEAPTRLTSNIYKLLVETGIHELETNLLKQLKNNHTP
jgi:hypothetical protein